MYNFIVFIEESWRTCHPSFSCTTQMLSLQTNQSFILTHQCFTNGIWLLILREASLVCASSHFHGYSQFPGSFQEWWKPHKLQLKSLTKLGWGGNLTHSCPEVYLECSGEERRGKVLLLLPWYWDFIQFQSSAGASPETSRTSCAQIGHVAL